LGQRFRTYLSGNFPDTGGGLAGADFDRKRALLELLVDRVVVTDGIVEIRYVVPTNPDGEREPFWRLRSDYRNRDRALETGDRGRVALV
jgi:hypothetical protein